MEIDAVLKRIALQDVKYSDNDWMLTKKIAGGDTCAWSTFFARYSTWVYRFVLSHLNGNQADAEDLCSDIMNTAAKSIGKFDPRRGDLDAWVFGIARHCLARFCRKRRIHLPLIPEIVDTSSVSETVPLDIAEEACVRDLVNRTLASLPQRQASILIAKYVDGYTSEEIARINETSLGAVESLLTRARTAFRSAFNRLLDSYGGDCNDR